MTWKYHNGLCTEDALDETDLEYFEARAQM